MQVDIHTQITNDIIKNLEQIQVLRENGSYKNTWSCPWSASTNTGLPANAATKTSYSGINILALWSNAMRNNYQSHLYLTFKQCKDLGGNVMKGEKGVRIVKLLTFSKENDEGLKVKSGAALRAYTVFNIDQCESLNIEIPMPPQKGSLDEAFNLFITDIGANISYGGNKACFVPAYDKILMPQECDFETVDEFKSTILHEITHWTGAKKRLDRDLSGRFGSKYYAMEELVAELGSAFLCAEWGVNNILSHTQYIDSWLKVLKHDNRAVFTAASKASQAVKFINEQAEKLAAATKAA